MNCEDYWPGPAHFATVFYEKFSEQFSDGDIYVITKQDPDTGDMYKLIYVLIQGRPFMYTEYEKRVLRAIEEQWNIELPDSLWENLYGFIPVR